MTRRDFVHGAGLGVLALAGAGLTPARAAARAAIRRNAPVGAPLGPEEEQILALAALAPSSHNTQPWTVRIHARRRWVVGVDPSRTLPAVDPANRELALSMGAFLENLSQAAGALGLAAEIEPRTGARDVAELCTVRLVPSARGDARAPDRIRSRATVRRGYASEPVRADDRRALEAPHAGSTAFFPGGSREAVWLGEAEVEAFRQQSWRDDTQAELARWIRFSDEEIERHADGLTPASMGLGPFARFYMAHFMNWKSVMGKRFRDAGTHATAAQVRQSGGWLVVTSRDESTPALLETGMHFERMALRLRERMLAAQPMSQTLEEAPWRARIARELGLAGVPQLVLRVGYVGEYPAPVSPRRAPADFTEVH